MQKTVEIISDFRRMNPPYLLIEINSSTISRAESHKFLVPSSSRTSNVTEIPTQSSRRPCNFCTFCDNLRKFKLSRMLLVILVKATKESIVTSSIFVCKNACNFTLQTQAAVHHQKSKKILAVSSPHSLTCIQPG